MNEELDGLVKNIQKAFADVAQPDAENIVLGDTTHFATCDECVTAREFFGGQTKESLFNDEAAWRQAINAFSLFSPQAWHYYLPVYLMGGLHSQYLRYNDFWHHDEPVVQIRHWPARVRQLTAPQCEVIICYLQYLLSKTNSQTDSFGRCQQVINWWQEIYEETFVAPKPV